MSEPGIATSGFELLCPTCGDHFQASETRYAPHRLQCGHAVCGACVEAVCGLQQPACPVCLQVVSSTEDVMVDIALAELAEACLGTEMGSAPQLARPACDAQDHPSLRERFAEFCSAYIEQAPSSESVTFETRVASLAAACREAAQKLTSSIPSCLQRKADVIDSFEKDCAAYDAAMDELVEAQHRHRAWVLNVARTRLREHVKALDDDLNCLNVSVAQLRAGITVAESMHSPDLKTAKPGLSPFHADQQAAALRCLEGIYPLASRVHSPSLSSTHLPLAEMVLVVLEETQACRAVRNAINIASECDRMWNSAISTPLETAVAQRICTAMNLPTNWSSLTPAACRALVSACANDASSASVLLASGELPTLCSQASVFQGGTEQLKQGFCAVLQRCCEVALGTGVPLPDPIAMRLAVSLLAATASQVTAVAAADAICWMAGSRGGASSADSSGNIDAFQTSDGLAVVLACLKRFSAQLTVCVACTSALLVLCRNTGMKRTACSTEYGVHGRVYVSMMTHISSAELQVNALGLLMNLCSLHEGRELFVSTGGVSHLYAAMDAHACDSSVQMAACKLLARAVTYTSVVERVVTGGGLERVFLAMSAHAFDTALQYAGMLALANISAVDETNVMLVVRGMLEAVCASMIRHPLNASIQELGCKALANVAADNMVKVLESPALSCIYNAMIQHGEAGAIQAEACRALCLIAGSRAGSRRLREDNAATTLLQEALHVHEFIPAVVDSARLALQRLSR